MKQIDVQQQQAILDGEVMRHRMRQTFESDTRVREGWRGRVGKQEALSAPEIIADWPASALAGHITEARRKEEDGGGRMKGRRGREGRLNGLARAEDKRRDGVVGLVAER